MSAAEIVFVAFIAFVVITVTAAISVKATKRRHEQEERDRVLRSRLRDDQNRAYHDLKEALKRFKEGQGGEETVALHIRDYISVKLQWAITQEDYDA